MLITDTYQEISLAFKDMMGVGQGQHPVGGTQMNWPTFATWASNSVGDNIRNETLVVLVKEIFAKFPPWFQKLIDELGPDWMVKLPFVQRLLAQMGQGLCGGNQWVFHEIGHKFALFGSMFAGQSVRNQTQLDAYLATFRPEQAHLALAMVQYCTPSKLVLLVCFAV